MSRARSGTILAAVGTGLILTGGLLRQAGSFELVLLAVVVFSTGVVLAALGLYGLLRAGWDASVRREGVSVPDAPADGSVWPPAPKGPSAQ